MHGYRPDISSLINMLHILKACHQAGCYEQVVRTAETMDEGDYLELEMLALEHVAPIYDEDELFYDFENDTWISGDDLPRTEETNIDYESPHRMHYFSSPEMLEYYRLCRVYEWREGIPPESNRYVHSAEAFLRRNFYRNNTVWYGLDEGDHPGHFYTEATSDYGYDTAVLVEDLSDMLMYYKDKLPALKLELAKKPAFLPMLPPAREVESHE